jgi:hypothetical protein
MSQGRAAIPDEVRALAEAVGRGDFRRGDVAGAKTALLQLGVNSSSEFFAFASEYCLGNLFPPSEDEALSDVCVPSGEVAAGTRFVREVWGLPEQYFCISSCQGEGCYLLSRTTGEVFDFSLARRHEFLAAPVARWASFYEFLRWYLRTPVAE